MVLSARLRAVASLVEPCGTAADVGTDHAYVPIYLVEAGICERAIAMDLRRGPLERAKEHIRSHNLSEYIETRLSDGVGMLKPGEADALILSGMGGRLIIRILTEGEEKLSSVQSFILQPQSETEAVRRFLQEQGYRITQEDMVCEDGKYYPMMSAVRGRMRCEREIGFAYGELLLAQKHPVLYGYLCAQEEKTQNLLARLKKRAGEDGDSDSLEESMGELNRRLWLTREALLCYREVLPAEKRENPGPGEKRVTFRDER